MKKMEELNFKKGKFYLRIKGSKEGSSTNSTIPGGIKETIIQSLKDKLKKK